MTEKSISANDSGDLIGIIYALSDPRNPSLPRYIGKTTQKLKRRYSGLCHWRKSQPDTPLGKWLNELFSLNLRPTIYMLEKTSVPELKQRETHWIKFFRPLGALLNISDGDGSLGLKKGPPCLANRLATIARNKHGMPQATRDKLSQIKRGKKQSVIQVKNWMATPGFQIAQEKFRKCNELRKKAVVAVETGQTFQSISDAARALGCSAPSFSRAIYMRWKCRGVHWEFANQEKESSGNNPVQPVL